MMPCVTLVSCCVPGRLSTAGVAPVARVHELPPSTEVHAAGKPLALPTATCMLLCAATLLTATCGSTAPGILARFTRCAAALVPVRVITGWRLSGPALMPAVTTAPSGASATPETASEAAAPKGRVCRQARPFAETNAVRVRLAWPVTPVIPVSTVPAGPPFAIPAVNPPAALRVAWNVQARPFGE